MLEPNCLKWNCFWQWNSTYTKPEVFNIELFWNLIVCKKNLYLYLTESAELELFEKTE